jgi:hypothetical protein
MMEDRVTCADKVHDAWQSRREDLEMMLDPKPEYLAINNELAKACENSWDLSYGETNFKIGLNADDFFDEYEDEIREAAMEAFHEYGLSFDYVAPGTFNDQEVGFWRYQISWGGPSEEIRFYADRDHHVYKAEFWYLDWFDGAPVNVTDDEIVGLLWDQFADTGTVDHVYKEAME